MKKEITKDEKMFKKTRTKFIALVMSIIGLIFVASDASIIIYQYVNENSETERSLTMALKDLNGNHDSNMNPNNPMENFRTFAIKVKEDKTYIFANGENAYSNFVATNIETFLTNKNGNISYVYYETTASTDVNYDYFIVGTDRSIERSTLLTNSLTMSGAFLISFIILFIVVTLFSKQILKPIKESIKKQKEFVADASHELKTPLTIIDANASILKENNTDNKWVNNILNETKNMNNIILDMISLVSTEEINTTLLPIDLSTLVNNIALSFDAICYERNIEYKLNINENININGNQKDVEKIVRILLDNAIKYVSNKGIIDVSLAKIKNNIYFAVYNSGCTIKNENRGKIFDRFYRDDESRDTTVAKGSGLGLAILKEISDKYNYKIVVESEENVFFKISIKF